MNTSDEQPEESLIADEGALDAAEELPSDCDEEDTGVQYRFEMLGWGAFLRWLIATAGGLFLGIVVVGVLTGSARSYPSSDFSALFSASVTGGLLGLVLGLCQTFVLSRYVNNSWVWIPATVVGWTFAAALGAYLEASFGSDFYGDIRSEVAWDVTKGVAIGTSIGLFQCLALFISGIRKAVWWLPSSVIVYGISLGVASYLLRVTDSLNVPASAPGPSFPFIPFVTSLLVFGATSGLALLTLMNGTVLLRSTRAILVTAAIIVGVLVPSLTVFQPALDKLLMPPRINISHEDYDRALAKWKAQNVQEYEIHVETTLFKGGDSLLRVSDGGRKILVLAPTPTSIQTPTSKLYEHYHVDTVEGMFGEIEDILDNDKMESIHGYYMIFRVDFHADLGYPVSIEVQSVTESGVQEFDVDLKKSVIALTILK